MVADAEGLWCAGQKAAMRAFVHRPPPPFPVFPQLLCFVLLSHCTRVTGLSVIRVSGCNAVLHAILNEVSLVCFSGLSRHRTGLRSGKQFESRSIVYGFLTLPGL
ncbi:hypothetical protein L798_05093 [Zootermopsis nevadensis]|uniref:Uncharacterized protein n=1 Tax=Zootermopsis nevadensis TaxID=136037 RepID=A0A067RCM7_ZOONE|nr:hypothetical protein L798_05093 [Zootermopsis nevadensis]